MKLFGGAGNALTRPAKCREWELIPQDEWGFWFISVASFHREMEESNPTPSAQMMMQSQLKENLFLETHTIYLLRHEPKKKREEIGEVTDRRTLSKSSCENRNENVDESQYLKTARYWELRRDRLPAAEYREGTNKNPKKDSYGFTDRTRRRRRTPASR